jgi:hypothetical protein
MWKEWRSNCESSTISSRRNRGFQGRTWWQS